MNFEYPKALWIWFNENSTRILRTEAPTGMPKQFAVQLDVLKHHLIRFGCGYRGKRTWLGRYREPHFELPSTTPFTRYEPSPATRDALYCAHLAFPLAPHLPVKLWGVFHEFMRLPALEDPYAVWDNVLRNDAPQPTFEAMPISLKLENVGGRVILVANGRNGIIADSSFYLPKASPSSDGSATVGQELQYLWACREHAQKEVERHGRWLAAEVREREKHHELRIAELRRVRKNQPDETTRAGQLVRNFHELLSNTDRDLLRRHANVFQSVFGNA
jgi:hypothetical protein